MMFFDLKPFIGKTDVKQHGDIIVGNDAAEGKTTNFRSADLYLDIIGIKLSFIAMVQNVF